MDIIANIQENTINISMHLLCNQKLHVSVLADHNEAVWSAKTGMYLFVTQKLQLC